MVKSFNNFRKFERFINRNKNIMDGEPLIKNVKYICSLIDPDEIIVEDSKIPNDLNIKIMLNGIEYFPNEGIINYIFFKNKNGELKKKLVSDLIAEQKGEYNKEDIIIKKLNNGIIFDINELDNVPIGLKVKELCKFDSFLDSKNNSVFNKLYPNANTIGFHIGNSFNEFKNEIYQFVFNINNIYLEDKKNVLLNTVADYKMFVRKALQSTSEWGGLVSSILKVSLHTAYEILENMHPSKKWLKTYDEMTRHTLYTLKFKFEDKGLYNRFIKDYENNIELRAVFLYLNENYNLSNKVFIEYLEYLYSYKMPEYFNISYKDMKDTFSNMLVKWDPGYIEFLITKAINDHFPGIIDKNIKEEMVKLAIEKYKNDIPRTSYYKLIVIDLLKTLYPNSKRWFKDLNRELAEILVINGSYINIPREVAIEMNDDYKRLWELNTGKSISGDFEPFIWAGKICCNIISKDDCIIFTTKETHKILYMYLTDIKNLKEFYKIFNFKINNETMIEDIDNNFKVFDVKGFIMTNNSYIDFIVENNQGIRGSFRINGFESKEDESSEHLNIYTY